MGSVNAPLETEFIIHFEAGANLRIGTKRTVRSTGNTRDGGIELHYYEYPVYCGRTVLVGQILQSALLQDMPSDMPEIIRHGGLCSPLTVNMHPGLAVEYLGHSIPIVTAQKMQIGQLVNSPASNKLRLIGRMDVFVCLPCCCTIPKLLNPDMIPWNQYDIYDCNYDFSGPVTSPGPISMKRGSVPSGKPNVTNVSCSTSAESSAPMPTAPVETRIYRPTAPMESSPIHNVTFRNEYNEDMPMATAVPAGTSNGRNLTVDQKKHTREGDLAALKRLKDSGVLDTKEYASKVNKVNEKHKVMEERDQDLEAITSLYEQGILSRREFEGKRAMIMKLRK